MAFVVVLVLLHIICSQRGVVYIYIARRSKIMRKLPIKLHPLYPGEGGAMRWLVDVLRHEASNT